MPSDDSFEKRLRALADQVARSLAETDYDEVANRLGVDPDRARGLGDAIGGWLNDRASGQEPLFGGGASGAPGTGGPGSDGTPGTGAAAGRPEDPRGDARPVPGAPPEPGPEPTHADATHAPPPATAARSAGPHPLDLPTDGQGRALAALDSGRWSLASGTGRLVATGTGAAPPEGGAGVDLVNELRARDWITVDGAPTLVGRQALLRWTATVAPATSTGDDRSV